MWRSYRLLTYRLSYKLVMAIGVFILMFVMASSHAFAQNISAITYKDGTQPRQIHAFVLGTDNHLYRRYWDGTGWHWGYQETPSDTTVASAASAITYNDGVRHNLAFVRGANNQLYVNYYPNFLLGWEWAASLGTPAGVTLTDVPNAITFRDSPQTQLIYVFVRGTNGRLYVRYKVGSQWQPWADQEAPSDTTVASAASTITYNDGVRRIYAFVRGANNHLYVRYWNGSKWNWAHLGTPPGTTITAVPNAITYKDGAQPQKIHVFVRGANNRLYRWLWDEQGTLSDTTVASIASAITYNDGVRRIYIFVRGTNNHLYVNSWNGSQWAWDSRGTPSDTTVTKAPNAITFQDGTQPPYIYTFVRGANKQLYVNYGSPPQGTWEKEGNPAFVLLASLQPEDTSIYLPTIQR